MTQSSVLPNVLYINDTRTVVFEINTQWKKMEGWAESSEEWQVECTVAVRSNFSGVLAILLVTAEGVRFGKAELLNMVRDKHNPALYHYTLRCLEPLKLIPTKELTDRLMPNTNLKEPITMSHSCPMPYKHPTELAVGDRIKTDICPADLKYDIRILNAFTVRQINNDSTNMTIHNMETFGLENKTYHSVQGIRCFIVWEQRYPKGATTVHVNERQVFAENMAEHKIHIFKEPDIENMVHSAVYPANTPIKRSAVFMSSEAYTMMDRKIKASDWSDRAHVPLGAKTDMYYDHVPLYEVKGIEGIRVWAGVEYE